MRQRTAGLVILAGIGITTLVLAAIDAARPAPASAPAPQEVAAAPVAEPAYRAAPVRPARDRTGSLLFGFTPERPRPAVARR